jgi:DNA-binding beta-propeller fold protein YncE
VYVSDYGNNRIVKYDSSGKFLAKITGCGSGATAKMAPANIAFDVQGNVYVADTLAGRICKFDAKGQFVTQWGSVGAGDGQFGASDPTNPTRVVLSPFGIAVDTQGNIYVSDMVNNRIMKFAPR